MSNHFHADATWRPLAIDYNNHHFDCQQCISAGQGRGQRCGAGQRLWATYQEAK